jgi:hypothetical protein
VSPRTNQINPGARASVVQQFHHTLSLWNGAVTVSITAILVAWDKRDTGRKAICGEYTYGT